MEGQTQTEGEGDERSQERLMEVCDSDRGKKCFRCVKGKTTIKRALTLDAERNVTVAHKGLIRNYSIFVINMKVECGDWFRKH